MSREIKFRIWYPSSKRMTPPFTLTEYATDQDGEFGALIYGTSAEQEAGDSVLMQYTGLKDKNGTPIYEGDVMIKQYGTQKLYKTVSFKQHFSEGSVAAGSYSGGYNGWSFTNGARYTVISTIYENPELLTA